MTITASATENKTMWSLDPSHSELGFKVKHLMITNVSGSFEKFNVDVLTDGDDFSTASIHLTADTRSITTNNEQRDGHIKAADFFDVEAYPEMNFVSTKIIKASDEQYKVIGDLTIKNLSKEVSLDVEFGGVSTDPWGNAKAGFSVNGKINRSEWEMHFNAALDNGGVLLSDEVKIHAEVQFSKKVN